MSYEIIKMQNGETIYLETKPTAISSEGPMQASLHDTIAKSKIDITNEFAKIGCFLSELREGLLSEFSEQQPNQLEFEVGIGFDQNIGCVLIGSTLNAQIGLKLIWENKNGNS